MVLIGAAAVAAIVSPDTDNNFAYQAFTLLIVLLAFAFVWSWFFWGHFAAKRILPRFGTAGVPIRYRVLIRNLAKRPQRGLMILEDVTDPRPSFREFAAAHKAAVRGMRSFRVSSKKQLYPIRDCGNKAFPLAPLLPGQEVEVAVEITPSRRGVLRFEGVTIARTDVLGIFRAFRRVNAPQSTLILPRRYVLPNLVMPGSMRYQQGGVALASQIGRSDEFVGLREYRRGDPLRHIHWRSWARVGKPVVREFEDEFFVRYALVLDTFTPNPLSPAFEEAVSVAASFACTLLTQESLLDLLFVGEKSYCFTAGRGLAHGDQMLEILASVKPCLNQSFQLLQHSVQSHVKIVSGVICVMLAWESQRQEFVRQLKLSGIPIKVFIILEAGASLNLDPGPMREAPEDFHVLEAGQVEQTLARMK